MNSLNKGSTGVIIELIFIKIMKPSEPLSNICTDGINGRNPLVAHDLLVLPMHPIVYIPCNLRTLDR